MEIVLEVPTSVEENTKHQTLPGCILHLSFLFSFPFFMPQKSLGCVVSTNSIKIHEISSMAFCLALARLGQPHSKFPEGGGNREKNDSMQINHSHRSKDKSVAKTKDADLQRTMETGRCRYQRSRA